MDSFYIYIFKSCGQSINTVTEKAYGKLDMQTSGFNGIWTIFAK